MQAGPDIQGWGLAACVLALLGFFCWHVVGSFIGAGKRIADYLDGGSARRRAALDRKIKFGRDPRWLRATRVLFVTLTLAIVAVAFWYKFRL